MWVQTESGQWKMHYTLTDECPGKTVTDEILPLSCIMSNVPVLFYFLWADKWSLFKMCGNMWEVTKIHVVKAVAFPLVMYGCESQTIKKAEHQRVDAFERWCWRRLLWVPWTARRSNQSIIKEISPEYPLEGQMLKLKLQYFGHLMWRTDSLEKTLMLGKIEGRRRRGQQRMRWFNGIMDLVDMSLSKLWDLVINMEAWHAAVCGVVKSLTRTEQLNRTDVSSSKGSGQLVSSNKRKTWKFGNRGVWMNVWEWIQSIEIFISHVNA